MRKTASTNRETIIKSESADDRDTTMLKVNNALKAFGGYVDGYLQLVISNNEVKDGFREYSFRIVRNENEF